MTNRSDIELALDRYLAEGAEQVADRVVDAALDQIEHTSQRHALGLPWRLDVMPTYVKSATAAAVLAILIVGGLLLSRGPSNIGTTTPSPSASAPASASAPPLPTSSAELLDISDWVPSYSARYGYEVSHPQDWTATLATTDRGPGSDDGADNSTDVFRFDDAILYVYEVEVPPGTSENDWISGDLEGCSPRFEDALSVSVDGQPGRMFVRDDCDDERAYFFMDGRVHVFVLVRGNQPGLLETFLSTAHFPVGAARLALPAPEAEVGALQTGRYEYRATFGAGRVNARFTVPAGWTWHGTHLSKDGLEPEEGAAIYFFEGPLEVYADPCQWASSNPSSSRSVADLITALADQPMRDATTPLDRPAPPPTITEAGWAGLVVELTVPADVDFADCDEGEFRSWGPEARARSHEAPGQRDLVWAIATNANGTAADGEHFIVDVASFPGTPADVMAEIDAILDSLYVGHWG